MCSAQRSHKENILTWVAFTLKALGPSSLHSYSFEKFACQESDLLHYDCHTTQGQLHGQQAKEGPHLAKEIQICLEKGKNIIYILHLKSKEDALLAGAFLGILMVWTGQHNGVHLTECQGVQYWQEGVPGIEGSLTEGCIFCS